MREKLLWLYTTAFGVDRAGSAYGSVPSIGELAGKFQRFIRNPAAELNEINQIRQHLRVLLDVVLARYLPAPLYEVDNRPSENSDLTLREIRRGLIDGAFLPTARGRAKTGQSAEEKPVWKSLSGTLRREQFLVGEFFHPVLASVVLGMVAYGVLWLTAWILIPLFAAIHPILIPVGMVLPVLCAIPVATSGSAAIEGLKERSLSVPGKLTRAATVCMLLFIGFFAVLQYCAWALLLLTTIALCRFGLVLVGLIQKPNPVIRAFGYCCFYAYLLGLAPLVLAIALFFGGTICFGAIAGSIVGLGRYLLLSQRKRLDCVSE